MTVVINNPSSIPLNVTGLQILYHYAWSAPNTFGINYIGNYTLLPGDNKFQFDFTVPDNFPLGEATDFACIVLYNFNKTAFDSGVVRPISATINRGKGLYVEQEISISNIVTPIFFFSLFITFSFLFRKKIKKLIKIHYRRMGWLIFICSFVVFVLSIHSNFSYWLVPVPRFEGFTVTGDEPHYVLIVKALIKGNLDMNQTYPWGVTQHTIVSSGLLNNGTLVASHGIGFPLLSVLPYILGEFFLRTGVYGVMIFTCLLASSIIVLIYKITLHLNENVYISLITSFTFAFSTLLFPWSGQLFTELLLGFFTLLIVYKFLTASGKLDWLLIGFVLGFYPFIKRQGMIVSLVLLGFLIIYLQKKKLLQNLRWLIPPFGSLFVIFIVYVVCFIGQVGFLLVGLGGGGEISIPPAINVLGIIPVSKVFYLGLLGLFIDSNSGLIFHSPILILSFLGILTFIRKNKNFFLLFTGINFFVWYLGAGLLGYWHGWISIPGRYMITILPLLSIPFAYGLQEFSKFILYKTTYIFLFTIGMIINGLIAFNRLLGYTIVWVNGIPRSRLILALNKELGDALIGLNSLPEFAFHWYHEGEIGSRPQDPLLLLSWSLFFLSMVSCFLLIGYIGEKRITKRWKKLKKKVKKKRKQKQKSLPSAVETKPTVHTA